MTVNKNFRILIIESKSGNHTHFFAELEKRQFNIIRVGNGSDGVKLIKEMPLPHSIVINAASLRTSGARICSNFRVLLPEVPIILIVPNGIPTIQFEDASLVLNLPFTVQKLINRLQLYVPAADKLLYAIGPIVLNMETNFLTCNGREAQLTPGLSRLLRFMMDKPGIVLERAELFRNVWETDYVEDTRTLDVHISWLRQALEEDPRSPKFIQTVRSRGYKLVI